MLDEILQQSKSMLVYDQHTGQIWCTTKEAINKKIHEANEQILAKFEEEDRKKWQNDFKEFMKLLGYTKR